MYAFWANAVAECVPLEPIRYVERELVSPDGTVVVKVRVPVYPPFELASQAAEKTWARDGQGVCRARGDAPEGVGPG